ncbi:bacterial regulatory s, tetR family protein [Pseudarthrobacter siccitolerans]|uniref:Bacterial regulatory s, tetR family protein n=1 Tax=Pseudarthrobacter siccitolerans TaxID=861266 RepID=A0A024H6K9_9MICC|nr:TetR/AcrR family transcriptional regulator [Pseudarthrobacter siccitolerans]CCQ47497.1 bacterial regulatory s, tetR family protein [Pseudarthrobacter siccitolerans]
MTSTHEPADPEPAKKLRPARTTATRQKLFDASMELIGERGAAGVTVDEIAAAAGVSKGTVYYNFGSKSDLIAQLLRHGVDILKGRLLGPQAEAGTAAPASDPLLAMEAMIGQAMDFMAEYPSFARLWVSENWRTPSEWQGTFTLLRAELLEVIGEAVEKVARVYPVDPSVSRGSLETAIFGACFVVGLDRQTYNPERTRNQSVAAIMAIMRGYVLRDAPPRG